LNPLQYDIPGRIMGNPPPETGPTAGVTVDEKAMDGEFMTEMRWDPETSKPYKERLIELGLEDIARELWD
jgi:aldehyde:ferredoxin oxidoreductase